MYHLNLSCLWIIKFKIGTEGALLEWEKVRKEGEPNTPLVVFPLGIEPSKPRALWDGRYVNEFAEPSPFQWIMLPRWQKYLGKEYDCISSK